MSKVSLEFEKVPERSQQCTDKIFPQLCARIKNSLRSAIRPIQYEKIDRSVKEFWLSRLNELNWRNFFQSEIFFFVNIL